MCALDLAVRPPDGYPDKRVAFVNLGDGETHLLEGHLHHLAISWPGVLTHFKLPRFVVLHHSLRVGQPPHRVQQGMGDAGAPIWTLSLECCLDRRCELGAGEIVAGRRLACARRFALPPKSPRPPQRPWPDH